MSLKAVLCGNSTVGKTTLLNSLTGLKDTDNQTSPTLGSGFANITFTFENEEKSINIWDTAGQERFRSLIKIYFRGAQIAFLVFDISNRNSFAALPNWINDIHNNCSDDTPILLVANKIDIPSREVSREDIVSFANENRLLFVECSAKTGEGTDDILSTAYRVYLRQFKYQNEAKDENESKENQDDNNTPNQSTNQDDNSVDLNDNKAIPKKDSCC